MRGWLISTGWYIDDWDDVSYTAAWRFVIVDQESGRVFIADDSTLAGKQDVGKKRRFEGADLVK
jgi:hypothetical protein